MVTLQITSEGDLPDRMHRCKRGAVARGKITRWPGHRCTSAAAVTLFLLTGFFEGALEPRRFSSRARLHVQSLHESDRRTAERLRSRLVKQRSFAWWISWRLFSFLRFYVLAWWSSRISMSEDN